MLNKICKKYCQNYLQITFMGRTVECCGANVDNADKCCINNDLYEKHVHMFSKKELAKEVGMNEEKLMRVLCRPEFSKIARIKQHDNHIMLAVTPRDIDNLKMWKSWKTRGGASCEN